MPDYADPRPPYRQIADDLRGQIKNGRLKPGERVPSNKALSERYSVATATIRSALDELRNEKLIQTQGTRGTYVLRVPAEPEPSPAEQLRQLMSRFEDVAQRLEKLERRVGSDLQHDGP